MIKSIWYYLKQIQNIPEIFLVTTLVSFSYGFEPIDKEYYDEYYANLFNNDSMMINGYNYRPVLWTVPQRSSTMAMYSTIASREKLGHRFDGELVIPFGDKIYYQINFRIANGSDNLNGYYGNKRQSIGEVRADILASGLVIANNHLLFSVNRGSIETSAMGENLMVNSNHYITDNIILSLRSNKYSMDNIIMVLGPLASSPKSVVYHRYGYKGTHLNLGFSEISVTAFNISEPGIVKYYLPFSFLYEVEANYPKNTNLLWRFDCTYDSNSRRIWFELLIDDYAISHLSPPKLAYLIGYHQKTLKYPIIANITKINRWVYNYGYPLEGLRFTNNDKLIGHHIGPDALEISIATKVTGGWKNFKYNIFPKISFLWQGEGNLFERTPVPAAVDFGYYYQPFLTGNVKYFTGFELFSTLSIKGIKFKSIVRNDKYGKEYRLILAYKLRYGI